MIFLSGNFPFSTAASAMGGKAARHTSSRAELVRESQPANELEAGRA